MNEFNISLHLHLRNLLCHAIFSVKEAIFIARKTCNETGNVFFCPKEIDIFLS